MGTAYSKRHYESYTKKGCRISAGTMCKLNKGEEVALSVLLRICDYLDCDIGDICEAVKIEGE